MLLEFASTPTTSLALKQLGAAALLSFSVQNECQLQIDLVSGIAILLRMLRDRHCDGELRVYVAAILWNITKSPLLLLKLETLHGLLKDQLQRQLTDILWTPLEPFQLHVTSTGERGTNGLLESDNSENLGVMLATSVSTELAIVLRIENYTGRPRSLTDQYRAKTPLKKKTRSGSNEVVEGKSVARYDESGLLTSRTCGVCGKSIKLWKKKSKRLNKAGELVYLECAKDGCEQTFHAMCSRWKALNDVQRRQNADDFYCGSCVVHLPKVHYCDFLADSTKHELLVTEERFKSIGFQRVDTGKTSAPSGDGSHIQYCALLAKDSGEALAIGVKKYRIPASSQDLEMCIVDVRFVRVSAYPATQQQQSSTLPVISTTDLLPVLPSQNWSVSYAKEGALAVPIAPDNTVFWSTEHLQQLDASQYTARSLVELETTFVYEFQGESRQDKVFAFGQPISIRADVSARGLWTTVYPRRGVCMKLLSEQIGHLKKLNELLRVGGTSNNNIPPSTRVAPSSKKKERLRKPHIGGKKLNRVVVETTTSNTSGNTS